MQANRRRAAVRPVSVDRASSISRRPETLGYNHSDMTWISVLRSTLLAITLLLIASACTEQGSILQQTSLSRSTLTPSTTDRLDLSYTLGRAARVSLSLVGPSGTPVELMA